MKVNEIPKYSMGDLLQVIKSFTWYDKSFLIEAQK